jgi:dethiobiotin synthetase
MALLVVTGTGTGVGKTHAAVAVLLRWGRSARVCGLKPVETGVPPGEDEGDDAKRLRLASSFHVKPPAVPAPHPPYRFADPVSPHLAARRSGQPIRLDAIRAWVAAVAPEADGLVVELAGGLFSPLGPGLLNADVLAALYPSATVVVAPDRLGVLHDVGALARAAAARDLRIAGVVLSAPLHPDASTGTNAEELRLVTDLPILGMLPRGAPEELADAPAIARLLAQMP